MTKAQTRGGITRRSAIRVFIGGGALIAAAPSLTLAAPSSSDRAMTIRDLFGGDIGPMVIIHQDNIVTLEAPIPDMGTGVEMALPMILAEELDVDWQQVKIERFKANSVPNAEGQRIQNYVHQGSGGSASVRTAWPQLRKCGVITRRIILTAAAVKLGVPYDQLSTDKGFVVTGGKRFPYADFIDDALMQDAGLVKQKFTAVDNPHEVPTYEIDIDGDFWAVKPRQEYAVIGKDVASPRLETLLRGEETFGIDHNLPGQLYASIERCPYIGGDVKSFRAEEAKALAGVVDVIAVPAVTAPDSDYEFNTPGVAVLATSYWAAYKARQLLKIEWDKGPQTHENTAWQYENSITAFDQDDKRDLHNSGDVEKGLASADKVLDVQYQAPHFAHLTIEPMNCVASVTDDGCVFGAGVQYPNGAIQFISDIFGIPVDNITHLTCKLGCGFGRRARDDYLAEAVYLSKTVKRPVKVIWTREDDIQHDFFNPMSVTRMRGGVDKDGTISAWDCLFSSQGGTNMQSFPTLLIPNMRIRHTRNASKAKLGAWRGPGHNLAGFYAEGFLNELAELAGRDPYEFRIALLGGDRGLPYTGWYPQRPENPTISTKRNKAVLKAVAEKANWKGGNPAPGKGRGIASHYTFGAFAAMVVDVTVDQTDGTFQVDRVTAAIDCGLVVHPSGARAQIESGIIDGLSAAVHQNIQFDEGRVTTRNFDDVYLTRMDTSPRHIDISFVGEDAEPFGTGEIALPAFIPALAAALYDATGVRIRKLPIGDQLKKT
ncbi:xanthine dehydrogenase family protein molybdopterin-binding subunit [Kordiimonas sediminis]|nr:molybdopterin cofactor-binding domain-containing protein [Kordiimonas sediminis]